MPTRTRPTHAFSLPLNHLAHIVASHRQPPNATHLCLPGIDYLASSDLHLISGVLRPVRLPTRRIPPVGQTITRDLALHMVPFSPSSSDEQEDDDQLGSNRWYRITTHRPTTRDTTDTTPADPNTLTLAERNYCAAEVRAHNALCLDGCAPLYPLSRLLSVYREPNRHPILLRPFVAGHPPQDYLAAGVTVPPPPECFFQRQYLRWQEFRRWQAASRHLPFPIDDSDPDFDSERAAEEQDFALFLQLVGSHPTSDDRDKRPTQTVESVAQGKQPDTSGSRVDEDLAMRQSAAWAHFATSRARERLRARAYAAAGLFTHQSSNVWQHTTDPTQSHELSVQQRLMRRGCAAPVALRRDFYTQDWLTTWVEYLSFEHMWLDEYEEAASSLRDKHDALLAVLCETAALQPHELVGSRHEGGEEQADDATAVRGGWLRTRDAVVARRAQRDLVCTEHGQALLAAERLRATAQQGDEETRATSRVREDGDGDDVVAAAVAAAEEVGKRKAEVVRRCEAIDTFVSETADYEAACVVLRRQRHLVGWVAEQYDVAQELMYPLRAAGRGRRTVISFASPLTGEDEQHVAANTTETASKRVESDDEEEDAAQRQLLEDQLAEDERRRLAEMAAAAEKYATATACPQSSSLLTTQPSSAKVSAQPTPSSPRDVPGVMTQTPPPPPTLKSAAQPAPPSHASGAAAQTPSPPVLRRSARIAERQRRKAEAEADVTTQKRQNTQVSAPASSTQRKRKREAATAPGPESYDEKRRSKRRAGKGEAVEGEKKDAVSGKKRKRAEEEEGEEVGSQTARRSRRRKM